MPKKHLLQEWKDPFYSTFAPPTVATTSATLSYESDRYKDEESRVWATRKKKNEGSFYKVKIINRCCILYCRLYFTARL